ncbi:MAG: hypothetical protein ACOYD4_09100 [Solirubrobacterales bacterium]
MTQRKAVFLLCMMGALLSGAVAVPGAAAATKGTTVFTCRTKAVEGGAGFLKEHCKAADATQVGAKFEHVAVAEGTTTDLKVTDEKTNSETNASTGQKLRTTIAGSAIEIQATGLIGEGGLENLKEPEGAHVGEHFVHVHELIIRFSNVKEKLLGCEVFGKPAGIKEVVETNKLTGTTTEQGDAIKFSAEAGKPIAEFELENCVIAPFTVKVFGSIICKPDGATVACNHNEVTAAKTLRIQNAKTGPLAGIEAVLTTSGKDTTAGDPVFNPLSVTTVETP